MITLARDPVSLAECLVTVVCLAVVLWRLSPGQQRKLRREQARDRMQLRRALARPFDRTDLRAPALSLSPRDDQKGQS